jgi:pimeloyl-ACP methyl ester carboxylesterase
MTYADVNGLRLWYEITGQSSQARPLILLHGGLHTAALSFGPLIAPLAAGRQIIAVELQGHGHTADIDRPLTISALAGDVIALLDQLRITRADLLGYSLGGLVAFEIAFQAPQRVGRLIAASADPYRPPGRESAPLDDDRMPTQADFQEMRDAYEATAPDPGHFGKFAARLEATVHEHPGWTADQLSTFRIPSLLIFGDRDFSPLTDVVELAGLLPDARLAVLPGTTHIGVSRRPAELAALITPFLDGQR